jgi:hypothetical protein
MSNYRMSDRAPLYALFIVVVAMAIFVFSAYQIIRMM